MRRRFGKLGAFAGLLAFVMTQAIAMTHLATHDRPHVHTAEGQTVYTDAPTSAVRSLFAELEAKAAKKTPARPAPHEARGLAHFAAPLLVALTVVFVGETSPAATVVLPSPPAFLPLEPVRRHDSRGPPVAAV